MWDEILFMMRVFVCQMGRCAGEEGGGVGGGRQS